jgi:hypothetical protein
VRQPLTWLFLLYTRVVYRRLARDVAAEIADYLRSGYAVAGLVGIGGSPSCGVRTTLDLPAALAAAAACDLACLDRRSFNQHVIVERIRPGEGLFVAALRRQLRRRRLNVELYEHDLVAELSGRPIPPVPLRGAPAGRDGPHGGEHQAG